ncbi:MAG: family 16 glycosylhydrolase [Infirmifilum sp.]
MFRGLVKDERSLYDEFEEKTPYWDYRTDNFASITLRDSKAVLCSGPTEALYYSNAEISDGRFDDLPWQMKTFEAKVRMTGTHFGSAGWGFWNHSMQFNLSRPIWFIHLQSRGPYLFQGFFAQAVTGFVPIKIYRGSLTAPSLLSRLTRGAIGVTIYTHKPVLQELDLSSWHVYKIEWQADSAAFYIDGNLVAKIPIRDSNFKARADVWIDNAVFGYNPKDAGQVYRHLTQENREKNCLEVDYIKIF